MRWLLAVASLCGCAATSSSVPAVPAPTASEPVGPPVLTESAALARAHAFFDAVDAHDPDAFGALITTGFALFEDGYVIAAEELSGHWRDSERPARERSCSDERVRMSPGAIVYLGDCREQQPAGSDTDAETWQGRNTVVLVPDGDQWKVALWQWQRSGIEGERIRWNDAYRRAKGYTTEPNRLLVDTVAALEPGTALVLAMGQGRNALHLAAKGWHVTGVDIAELGVAAARTAAAERGLALDAVVADVDDYDMGQARWDLVTMMYLTPSRAGLRAPRPRSFPVAPSSPSTTPATPPIPAAVASTATSSSRRSAAGSSSGPTPSRTSPTGARPKRPWSASSPASRPPRDRPSGRGVRARVARIAWAQNALAA